MSGTREGRRGEALMGTGFYLGITTQMFWKSESLPSMHKDRDSIARNAKIKNAWNTHFEMVKMIHF